MGLKAILEQSKRSLEFEILFIDNSTHVCANSDILILHVILYWYCPTTPTYVQRLESYKADQRKSFSVVSPK